MTDAVKLAGNTTPAVQGGNGRSREKSEQGGFEMLFRLGAKAGKADSARAAGAARQGIGGMELLARLEAAMALRDGARGIGEAASPERETAESEREEHDPEEAAITPAIAAMAAAGTQRHGDAGRPVAAAKGSRAADGAAVAKADAAAENASRGDAAELKPAAASGQAGAAAPVQPAAQPEPKGGDFTVFVPTEEAPTANAAAGSESAGAASEDRRGGGEVTPARVTVLAQNSVTAPGLATAGTNAALVAGLSSDAGWQNSARSVAALQHQAAQIGSAPLHTMKLQLHPAELGMVTANLRFAGDQLQVELQVENREAYDRLQGDSEAIVKSLRALGYEIDQVSVQQPQIANNTAARAETNFGSTNGSGRDAQAFGSQGERGNGERLGGQGSGREEPNTGRDGSNAQASQDNAQRGIYI